MGAQERQHEGQDKEGTGHVGGEAVSDAVAIVGKTRRRKNEENRKESVEQRTDRLLAVREANCLGEKFTHRENR